MGVPKKPHMLGDKIRVKEYLNISYEILRGLDPKLINLYLFEVVASQLIRPCLLLQAGESLLFQIQKILPDYSNHSYLFFFLLNFEINLSKLSENQNICS